MVFLWLFSSDANLSQMTEFTQHAVGNAACHSGSVHLGGGSGLGGEGLGGDGLEQGIGTRRTGCQQVPMSLPTDGTKTAWQDGMH
jgi:hypothetical protein